MAASAEAVKQNVLSMVSKTFLVVVLNVLKRRGRREIEKCEAVILGRRRCL